MKKIHPKLRKILFLDINNGKKFLSSSCMCVKGLKKTYIGKSVFFIKKVDITSASHVFYIRNERIIEKGGKMETFLNKYVSKK
ncbi:50S ribosomal protein L31 [Candidatus Vidania fulgoroideorum]